MASESSGFEEIPLEQRFPWLRLFRGVGVSIDAKKLILAMVGLVAFAIGRQGLDRLFTRPAPLVMSPSLADRPSILSPRFRELPGPLLGEGRGGLPAELRSAPWKLTEPVRYLVGPFVGVFALRSNAPALLHALLSAVWGTLVWSTLGGAIARIAVVQVARTERIGLAEALRFAGRKWLSLVGTPLCPLLGVAFFATFCAAFGLLYRAGSPGSILAGIFAVFPILAGLVMAIILISLAAGWPLMIATVAAEGEDGFDALSRSFAYVNQRPGRYAAYTLLAWGLGILGLILVSLFARTTVHMAEWSLSFGAPDDVLKALFHGGTTPVASAARGAHTFWFSLVGLVAHAWVYSYFWTSATIIYLVLRHDVDGTPWHAIAAPERRAFEFAPDPVAEKVGAGSEVEAAPGQSVVPDAPVSP